MEQNIIADLINSISCFRTLAIGERERLGNLLTDRLWLLSHKVARSPFEPLKFNDFFGVNQMFPAALAKWVAQFTTEESRAGALLIALSVQYFTREQFDSLLTDVAEQYQSDSKKEPAGPFRAVARPLTPHTDLHSRFTRQAQMSQTTPDDVNLEKFNHQAAHLLANSSADAEVPTPYYSLEDCIQELLDLDCVLIEDWSLSGTTLAYAVLNFLRICNLVFGDLVIRQAIAAHGHALPRVRAVTLVATDGAMQRFNERCADGRFRPFIAARPLIVGCRLGGKDRITTDSAPAGIQQIGQFVPSLEWKSCVLSALRDFQSKAGESLIDFAKRLGFSERTDWNQFVSFGFNAGGWLAVSYANCPSNSLPILWYQDPAPKFRALFPRAESNHSSYKPEVRDWLSTAEKSSDRLTPRVRNAVKAVLSRQ